MNFSLTAVGLTTITTAVIACSTAHLVSSEHKVDNSDDYGRDGIIDLHERWILPPKYAVVLFSADHNEFWYRDSSSKIPEVLRSLDKTFELPLTEDRWHRIDIEGKSLPVNLPLNCAPWYGSLYPSLNPQPFNTIGGMTIEDSKGLSFADETGAITGPERYCDLEYVSRVQMIGSLQPSKDPLTDFYCWLAGVPSDEHEQPDKVLLSENGLPSPGLLVSIYRTVFVSNWISRTRFLLATVITIGSLAGKDRDYSIKTVNG